MREIKFRGRHVDNGEWVYGSLHIISGDTYIIAKDTGHFSIRSGEDIFITAYIDEVDPETVGQFTGLHDKNGKEIYEGDIVRCWGGEYCQGYWEFDKTFVIKNTSYDIIMLEESEHIEVIGNIYENPELLND